MIEYEKYMSDTPVTVTSQDYYTDSSGYQNEKAFWDFAMHLTANDKMYLLCLDIDLTPSNAKGTGFGDLVMRTFFIKMRQYFPVFRMRGTKFNLFIPQEKVEEAIRMMETNNGNFFTLHGEVLRDKFVSSQNIEEMLKEGVRRMLDGRVDTDNIVGSKGNTPAEKQETPTRKYIAEMWYAVIEFTEVKPTPRKLTAYVFPTEYKKPTAMLHQVIVLDDMISPRVFEGTVIHLPIDGMQMCVTSRFNHDGKLDVSYSRAADKVDGDIFGAIKVHEGDWIPVSFGKRVGTGKEIFPIRMNSQGLYEYVLYDRAAEAPHKPVQYISSGIVNGKKNDYEVHMDSELIDLVKIDK